MNKLFILFCLLCSLYTHGQEKIVRDLDGDELYDTVFLASGSNRIVCRLSSLHFQPLRSMVLDLAGDQNGVRETKNGFELWSSYMRAGHACQFRFDPGTRKIQLIGISEYSFGNAANDGSGEGSLNLLTNTYIGEWKYYNDARQKLIKLPTIKERVTLGKIYLERFNTKIIEDFQLRSSDLYEKQKRLQ